MFFSTISLTAGAVQKKMIENSPKNRFGPCNILQLRYLTTVFSQSNLCFQPLYSFTVLSSY